MIAYLKSQCPALVCMFESAAMHSTAQSDKHRQLLVVARQCYLCRTAIALIC